MRRKAILPVYSVGSRVKKLLLIVVGEVSASGLELAFEINPLLKPLPPRSLKTSARAMFF